MQSCSGGKFREKEGWLVQVQTGGRMDGETELDIMEISSCGQIMENLEDVTKVAHPGKNNLG